MAEGVFQTSFGAGELSPNLYAREDIEKYSSGAALMRNFYVDYRGGASNRPGTEFMAQCYSSGATRLIPFIFSQDQSYVLEFSNTHIRIYQFGAIVADITSPYPADALFYLKYVQSADVMTITHPDYPPYNLSRTSLTTFTLEAVTVGPDIPAPANLVATASNAGALRYGYVVTALTANGEESLGSFPAFCDSVALDPTNATPKTTKQAWTAVTDARAYNVYKWGPVPNAQPMPTLFGYIGQTKTNSFTDTNIAADYSRVPPEYRDPFSPGQITDIVVTAGGTGYSGYLGITITGDGAGATGYAIANAAGAIVAVVVTNTGANYTTATVSPASGAATFTATIDSGNHYPSVVTYFQQRRVYGGADSSPELLEFSQIGAYDNFDVSPAVLDSDSITVNIASRQVNDIKALVPMSTGLIVFTTGCAFLVAGGNDNTVVTPASVSAVPQASTGSNDIPPITVNYNILFVQQKGAIVRDMAFSFQTQSYYGVDRSMLANHLFFGFNIVDWAWAEEPYKLLWVVRNDGRCLVMTYVPDQEVYGWSQHDTNGLFKSVCTIPEGDQDATYFVVRRFIQADQEWKNYFERLSFRTCDCPADAAFLDSFVSIARVPGNSEIQIALNGDDATITAASGETAAFIMTAEENYPPEIATYMAANNTLPEAMYSGNALLGNAFDPVTRNLVWPSMWYLPGSFSDAAVNTTGYTLWDGANSYVPLVDIDQSSMFTLAICYKNIDTGVVTWVNVYDPNAVVPAGIGGGDGTWRRTTFDLNNSDGNLPCLTDPRTFNIAVKTQSCELHIFRASDGHKQTLSPFFPVDDIANAVLPFAMTDDWLYGAESNEGPGLLHLYCIPRERTAEETTQDYLLSYATYDFPSTFETDSLCYGYTATFDHSIDGNVYIFTNKGATGGVYKLWKFTPPTSAPYGGPVVGGGFTDITPWAPGAGPDLAAVGATRGTWSPLSRNFAMYLPSNSDDQNLGLVNTIYPDDWTSVTAYQHFGMFYTRYNITTPAYNYRGKFVNGYMKSDWTMAVGVSTAAYAVLDYYFVNPYLNKHAYDFYPSTHGNYFLRWIYFACRPVVDGVVDTDDDHIRIVMARYFFSTAAPSLDVFYDEQGWNDNYPVYKGLITQPVVYGSMVPYTGAFEVAGEQRDSGVYDYTKNEFWWSGGFTFNSNLYTLQQNFQFRANFEFPSNQSITPPILRLGFGPTVGQVVDIGCGSITITGVDGLTYTGVVDAPLHNYVADDPFHTLAPVPAYDWFIATPANSISVSHLIGMEVGLLVDGLVHERQIVGPTGIVTWPEEQATTRAVCGLPYQAQLKTMYLTTGEPTTQGRMKVISQVIVRVTCTLGIKVGVADFLDMYEAKDTMVVPYSAPPEHFQGDIQMNVGNDWNLYGQVCIQQDYPLPVTVLGVIPQVVIGDDD